jgi:hypothetical protein
MHVMLCHAMPCSAMQCHDGRNPEPNICSQNCTEGEGEAQGESDHDMYIPLAVSEQVKKLPYFSLAYNWNELPLEKLYPNHLTFKLSLLDHLKNDWQA